MKTAILLIITVFFSCKHLKKDIPVNENGDYDYIFRRISMLTQKSKLTRLDQGIDSMSIRFWFSGPYRDTVKIIELQNKNHNWKQQEYKLIEIYEDDLGEKLNAKLISTNFTKPKIAWNFLVDSLVALGIKTLPNAVEIPNYTSPHHGNRVIVEIANKYNYRIYNLPIIQFMENMTIPEARKGTKIVRIIEKEFEFNSYIK